MDETTDVEVQVPTRRRDEPSQKLTNDQQDLFLELLSKGASPAMACRQLSLALSDANFSQHVDAEFAHRWREIEQALSQNVASALYSSAIKGTVSAQTFYLKNQPPPGWEEKEQKRLSGDNFEERTDAELVQLAGTIGAHLPPEIADGTELPGDEEGSGRLSQTDPD